MSYCKPFILRFCGRLVSGLLVSCWPSSFLRSLHFSAFSLMALLVYRCSEEVPSVSPFLGLALLSSGRESGRLSTGGKRLSLSSSPLSSGSPPGSRSCPLSFCSWLFVPSDSGSGGSAFFGFPLFSPETAGLVPVLCSLPSPSLFSSDKALSDLKKKKEKYQSEFSTSTLICVHSQSNEFRGFEHYLLRLASFCIFLKLSRRDRNSARWWDSRHTIWIRLAAFQRLLSLKLLQDLCGDRKEHKCVPKPASCWFYWNWCCSRLLRPCH